MFDIEVQEMAADTRKLIANLADAADAVLAVVDRRWDRHPDFAKENTEFNRRLQNLTDAVSVAKVCLLVDSAPHAPAPGE